MPVFIHEFGMPLTKPQAPRTHLLTLACRRDIDLFGCLSSGYYYSSISLCLADAVFSIGVSYESVKNVIRRVAEKAGIETDRRIWRKPDPLPLTRFLPMAKGAGFFGSRQRTSTKGGILKSEAVVLASEAFLSQGINTLGEFQTCDETKLEAVRDAFCNVHGQGSGLAWAYLRNLAGDESQVKADRHLMNYVERETAATLKGGEVVALVQQAAAKLQRDYSHMTPRLLEHLIWRFESGRGAKSKGA